MMTLLVWAGDKNKLLLRVLYIIQKKKEDKEIKVDELRDLNFKNLRPILNAITSTEKSTFGKNIVDSC